MLYLHKICIWLDDLDMYVERFNLSSHQHDKHEKKKFDIGNLIKYLIFYFF